MANVGDSGFIVLRHGAVYKRSSPMHHAFSLPVHIERGDDPSCVAQVSITPVLTIEKPAIIKFINMILTRSFLYGFSSTELIWKRRI